MKVRTLLELTNALDDSLAWRKKEIAALRALISGRLRDHERAVMRRAAVAMLYAHWEGFTKEAALFYLEYVLRQKRALADLTGNFSAMVARRYIREAGQSKKLSVHIATVDRLFAMNTQAPDFFPPKAIDTESNLSSTVLQEIFLALGLSYDATWQTRALQIDGSLLRMRNEIAHGEDCSVDEPTYKALHDLVLDILDWVKTGIENNAATRAFLRSA